MFLSLSHSAPDSEPKGPSVHSCGAFLAPYPLYRKGGNPTEAVIYLFYVITRKTVWFSANQNVLERGSSFSLESSFLCYDRSNLIHAFLTTDRMDKDWKGDSAIEKGIPQGSSLSPVLMDIFWHPWDCRITSYSSHLFISLGRFC